MQTDRMRLMPRTRLIAKLFVTTSVCAFLSLMTWVMYENRKIVNTAQINDNNNNNRVVTRHPLPYIRATHLVSLPGCHIPNIDPFTDEVKSMYSRKTHLKCPGKPSFLEVVNRTTLVINATKLRRNFRQRLKSCHYAAVIRNGSDKKKPDDSILYVPRNNSEFTQKVTIRDEFVRVNCYDTKGKMFYQEFVTLVQIKEEVEQRCDPKWKQNRSPDRLNILVFGIDSISKLNFLRHFQKTYRLLKSLKAIELFGYNKVEKNTLVNMVPLLTGRYLGDYWNASMPPFFDHIDLLWKEYAERGYRTLFAEDAPNIGMFNFRKKGFRNPPSDYYFRPAAIALEMSILKKRSREHCFGNRSEFSFVLDWALKFLTLFKAKAYFAWVFLSRLTHDQLNYAGYADEPTEEFIRTLYLREKCMNNTLMVFMSDHGIRFGSILKTYIGKLEERLPFMFLLFPEWFLEKYPDLKDNLQKNERRLTNNFDIFETLKDVLQMSTGEPVTGRHSPGISLFNEVPENRTCEEATISGHYCACHRYEPVELNDTQVVGASAMVVDHMNTMTSGVRSKCAKLTLHRVMDARRNQPKSNMRQVTRPIVDYLIVVQVKPSDGEFEATVRYMHEQRTYTLLGQVSRINVYGNQSHCITGHMLAPICYCNQHTT